MAQDFEQPESKPPDEQAEVLACRGEDGVRGVAGAVGEVISLHAMLGLDVSDDRLDGGAALEVSLDLGRYAAFLA